MNISACKVRHIGRTLQYLENMILRILSYDYEAVKILNTRKA